MWNHTRIMTERFVFLCCPFFHKVTFKNLWGSVFFFEQLSYVTHRFKRNDQLISFNVHFWPVAQEDLNVNKRQHLVDSLLLICVSHPGNIFRAIQMFFFTKNLKLFFTTFSIDNTDLVLRCPVAFIYQSKMRMFFFNLHVKATDFVKRSKLILF